MTHLTHTLRICAVLGLGWLALACLAATPALAQSTTRAPIDADSLPPPSAGWSVTPSIGYAAVWDNNILFDDEEANPIGDGLNIVRPSVSLDFRGRRGELGARYDGGFVLHHDLTSLNSYEQRIALSGRRQLTPRAAFFVRHNAAMVPTTELAELVGVPYSRIGSHLQDLRTGVEFAVSRRTQTAVTYHFQRVDFDSADEIPVALTGGHSHGGALSLTHALTPRTSVIGDYIVERASLNNDERFTLHTAWGGVEHRVTDLFRVFGAAGVSHLGLESQSRTGPAWRAGLARDFRRAGVTVVYSRSFVPSYGFGGTSENEAVTGSLQLPIGRRLSLRTGLAWHRNQPLDAEDLSLETLWFESSVAYALTRWIRVEGFVTGTHQTIDRPGGTLDRYRFGVQVTAATTARIR